MTRDCRFVLMKKGLECQHCDYCGVWCRPTRDHIVPRSLGGTLSMDNVAYVCYKCNCDKGCLRLGSWVRQLSTKSPQHMYLPRRLWQLTLEGHPVAETLWEELGWE